ncbi:MAG: sugar-binding protein [Acidobacteriota bacterium]
MIRHRNSTVLLLFACVLALTGCSRQPAEGSRQYSIAFVAGAATDFWTYAEAGCRKADAELENVTVTFKYTGDGASADQRRIVDDLLVTGIDGLVITPLDAVNQGPLVNRAAEQVPVVITDSDIPGSNRICYIGTSNVEAGRTAGRLIKEVLPEGGRIMLFVGKTDAQNAKERIEGLKEEISGSNIEILDIKTDDIDRVRAKANVNDVLVKYPNVSCLVGLWSYNGPAILNAVRDSGKLDQIPIVAFDEEEETINGVKDGHIYATIVQQPFEFGYQSVHLLAKVLAGDRAAIPADGTIIIPTRVIRQNQAEDFLKHIQSLRSSGN